MKRAIFKKSMKYVYALLKKYGKKLTTKKSMSAKEIIKKNLKNFISMATKTFFESLLINYAIIPLKNYGLKLCKHGAMSKEEFLDGLV